MILVKFIMFLKNQLLIISFLLLLASSITTTQKNNPKNNPPTLTSHPSPSIQTKANKTKEIKVIEVAKTATSEAKNQKKQATTTEQAKRAELVASKVAPKPSVKSKERSGKGKKPQKALQKSKKSELSKAQQSNESQQHKQAAKALKLQKPEGHHFWGLFIVYTLILGVLGYGAKYVYFPHSNNAFQLLLDVIIKIKDFKLNGGKQGYRAPEYNQEVDDSNSITVGYTQDHAKQLFWEKNSVEGI